MKELSIQEKAKRYDEYIEQLRTMMPNWENLSYNGKTFLQDLVHIIPELKESEDERIRIALITFFQRFPYESIDVAGTNVNEAIAWLEKQGEQNPAWSEEDEKILNLIIASLHSHQNVESEEYGKDYHWLKSLKDRYIWKPSEEQMEALKEAVDEHFDIDGGALWHLYEDLKKLMKE